ncbi:MAG: hypothetical protein AAF721_23380 [Myxococcota bacterium]
MPIPARAITRPSLRSLQLFDGPNGLFNQRIEPFALRRAVFRITAETLTGDGVEEALDVLASLAPPGTNWLGSEVLQLGGQRGVWRVSGRYIEATRSRRLSAPPLIDRTTPVWYATYGLPRVPDGMHLFTTGTRQLLQRHH